MAIEKTINIKVDTGNSANQLKKVSKATEKVGDKAKESSGSLDRMTGGAIGKFKGLLSGLRSVALGFKSIGFAIAASGIGLIVITIAALTAAFKGSESGQNKFAKLMSVIGAITGNLVDVLADLGDFIINLFSGDGKAMTQLKSFGEAIFNVIGLPIKNVIDTVKALGKVLGALFDGDIDKAFEELNNGIEDVKGNFDEAKESINGATDALKGFVQQNIDEAKAAAKVADQRAKADTIERNLIVDKAKAEREIADLRLKAKDLNNVSAKEREDALKRVLEIQDDLIKRETEVLELRRDAQIAENTFARSNKENLTLEQEAIAAVIAAQTRRVDQQRTIQRELTAAENEIRAERKAKDKEVQDAADARFKERQKEIKEFQKQSDDNELEDLKIKEDAKTDIIQQGVDNRIAQSEREAEEKILLDQAVADARVSITNQTLNLVGSIAKEGSAVAKGVAVAQATISGIEGVQNAFTTAAKSPVTTVFPAYPFVQAGLAGAFSAIQIAKILSVKPQKGGGGSSSAGSRGGGGGGGASAPAFNLVAGTGSNQVAQSLQSTNEPVKAFVVSSEMTSNQELDRNIKSNATI